MNNYVKTYKGTDKHSRLPMHIIIIYILTAFTVILHIATAFLPQLADGINGSISSFIRFILAQITDLIPFSLAEMLILLIPVIVFLIIRHAFKHYSDSWQSVIMYICSVLALICSVYMMFFWTFGVGYNTTSLDKKLELDRQTVSAEELRDTAVLLSQEADKASKNVSFREKSFSVMPYDIDELSDKLCDAYSSLTEKYSFISKLNSDLKPVMLSEAMSYTHITGIYSYFTGEANINVHFPDYTIPYTAAHELAHQRGIAREDEANFIAFLVCLESSDPYIRYSGYMNMLDYVLNALYKTDIEMYKETVRSLNLNIYYEMVAYSNFFDKYRDSTASNVSGAINDTYLKLNGTEGERSYGMVVDLAVAYYKNK